MTATSATSTLVTPTCHNEDTFTTVAVLTALEAAWTAIRTRHPQVPAVVLVVGSGSPRKAADSLTLGHFAASTWQHGDTQLAEVMVSGEGLHRPPSEVLATLLHEAAHGLAHVTGVKDTSRQGRWHNKHFRILAIELGLNVANDSRIGWSLTTLTADTARIYTPVIGELGAAMRAYRRLDHIATTRTNNNNGLSAECACPRKIRVSHAVFDEGPIFCGVCDTPFLDPDLDDPDSDEADR